MTINTQKLFKEQIGKLQTAISTKNKKDILAVYEKINLMNFNTIPEYLLDEYDLLVETGNEIILI